MGMLAVVGKTPHLWPCTVVRSSRFERSDNDDDDDDDEDDRLRRTFARKASSSGSDG